MEVLIFGYARFVSGLSFEPGAARPGFWPHAGNPGQGQTLLPWPPEAAYDCA